MKHKILIDIPPYYIDTLGLGGGHDNKSRMLGKKTDNTPYTVAQLYGLPHGIFHIFNTILYENEFQNHQIFQQTINLFPEQSTL
jgi:hypothetical protein